MVPEIKKVQILKKGSDNHDAFNRNPLDVVFNRTLRIIINNYSKSARVEYGLCAALATNLSYSASTGRIIVFLKTAIKYH